MFLNQKTSSDMNRMRGTHLIRMLTCLGAVVWCGQFATAPAQTVINVPPDSAPSSVGADTTLNLFDGGVLVDGFGANSGSTVNITGGNVGTFLHGNSGSTINVSGGKIGPTFTANSGSTVRIAGGTVDIQFNARSGSTVQISGGVFGDEFEAHSSSTLQMSGLQFAVNGALVPGLDNVGDMVELNITQDQLLSGTFADGTPFAFAKFDSEHSSSGDLIADGTLTLIRSAEPPAGPAIIHIPSDPPPLGVRAGQTLHLANGGILGDHFNAGAGSVMNIAGGTIGRNFEAVGAEININGGTLGDFFDAFNGSTVNMAGGSVGNEFGASDGSTVNITGGTVGDHFTAKFGSIVNISGGTVADEFRARSGSTVNITGGAVGHEFHAEDGSTVNISGGSMGGSAFRALSGSTVTIAGGRFGDGSITNSGSTVQISGLDFAVDEVLLPGLDSAGDMVPLNVADGQLFSGTFANGTPFAFATFDDNFFANGTLTLIRSPDPTPGPAVIQVPSDPAPPGVRAGQTLHLADGGALGDHFNAGAGSVVNIEGGTVGKNFEAVDAEINVTGGTVGRDFDAFAGSIVNISGGTMGVLFDAERGSIVNISGGSVGSSFNANGGSEVHISGGTVDTFFNANSGSAVHITGGTLGMFFEAEGVSIVNISGGTVGHLLRANPGSTVNLSGGSVGDRIEAINGSSVVLNGLQFAVDGVPVPGLDNVGDMVPLNVSPDQQLSGTFADGTPFVFARIDGDHFRDGTLSLIRSTAPPPGPATIHVPSDPAPLGVRAGQTLHLADGGTLGDHFNAGSGSVTNIEGGTVGENFEALDAEINISGGTAGDHFDAFPGATVNITGGTVGDEFDAFSGSTVNIMGGTLGDDFRANLGSSVHITGGIVGERLLALPASTIHVAGGTVGKQLFVEPGSTVNFSGGTVGDNIIAVDGASVVLSGLQFAVDSTPVPGLDNVGDMVQLNIADDELLSGNFANGTPFAFTSFDGDSFAAGTLTLVRSADPPPGPAVIHVPADAAPLGVRDGQTLHLANGGALGEYFNAGAGSEVNIERGTVGAGFEAVGAEINISGGAVDTGFSAFDGSVVQISGGEFADGFHAFAGSVVEISALAFLLNGEPIPGLASVGDSLVLTQRNLFLLSGTFPGGTPFDFVLHGRFFETPIDHFSPDATLRLTVVVPEPGTFVLAGIAAVIAFVRFKHHKQNPARS